MAANKLRNKLEYHGEDKKKKKKLPSTSGEKVADNEMDDMTKLINNLFAKINRLEMENRNKNKPVQDNDNINLHQFIRSFNPNPRDVEQLVAGYG